jgi:cyclophilin family peptidyl-prolyl cis-trans isomerase
MSCVQRDAPGWCTMAGSLFAVANRSSVRRTALFGGSLFVALSAAVGVGAYATREDATSVVIEGSGVIEGTVPGTGLALGPSTDSSADPVSPDPANPDGVTTTSIDGASIGAIDTITGETIGSTTTAASTTTTRPSETTSTIGAVPTTSSATSTSSTTSESSIPGVTSSTTALGLGASNDPSKSCPPMDASGERIMSFTAAPVDCLDPKATYSAIITTSSGEFTIALDQKAAPKATNVFVFLARHKFYDGLTFHRVIPGFIIQGGDPLGTGNGGPGFTFADELPKESGYPIGSVAMANAQVENTNGSQFFIAVGDTALQLPPTYTKFGKVSKGRDTLKAIESLGKPAEGSQEFPPTQSIVIQRVEIKAVGERASRVPGRATTTTVKP